MKALKTHFQQKYENTNNTNIYENPKYYKTYERNIKMLLFHYIDNKQQIGINFYLALIVGYKYCAAHSINLFFNASWIYLKTTKKINNRISIPVLLGKKKFLEAKHIYQMIFYEGNEYIHDIILLDKCAYYYVHCFQIEL